MAFLNKKLAANMMSSYSAWKSGLATLQLTSETSDFFVLPSEALRKNTMEMEGSAGIFFFL